MVIVVVARDLVVVIVSIAMVFGQDIDHVVKFFR